MRRSQRFVEIVSVLALSLMATQALAFDPNDVQLGYPEHAGTGCPIGSVAAVLSPDAKELSILFDNYVTEAGGSTGRTIDRKNCTFAIPVHIPQGYSVSVIGVDYRGFYTLPAGAQAKFSSQLFFAGDAGTPLMRTFTGPSDDEYLLSTGLFNENVVWSRCGDDVIMRGNTSMFVRNSNPSIEAIATVDSADISAGLLFQLQWRHC